MQRQKLPSSTNNQKDNDNEKNNHARELCDAACVAIFCAVLLSKLWHR